MSSIFLTSTGLSNEKVRDRFIIEAGETKDKSVAIVITASREKEKDQYCQLAYKQMGEIGFGKVDFVDLETDPNWDFLNYEVIYVNGGDPFKLLKFAQSANFKKSIEALLDRGGIYVGVSAGSYIMCPTIEMALWKEPGKDRFGLINLTAFNFVPFLLTVHFEPKLADIIKKGIANTKYSTKILTDNQAFLIKNNMIELIGDDEEIKL